MREHIYFEADINRDGLIEEEGVLGFDALNGIGDRHRMEGIGRNAGL